jgi:hypothetical protein
MTRPVTSVVLAGLLATSASAADSPVQIRQNVNVKKDVAKPSFLLVTLPQDKPAIYQMALGLLADMPTGKRSPLLSISGLLDYQRNSAVAAQQDVIKAGLSSEWQWVEVDPSGSAGPGSRWHSSVLSSRVNFKSDRIKDTRGIQEALYYTHFFVGKNERRVPLPNRIWSAGHVLELEYSPTAGIELEHVLAAPKNGETGTIVRMMAQTNVGVYPAGEQLDYRVEFLIGGGYRYDAKRIDTGAMRSHPLFTFEANYMLTGQRSRAQVGFGATYVHGEDPDEGLQHQQYWQLALKLRVK